MKTSAVDRILSKCQESQGCWLFSGSKVKGYGQIRVGRATLLAHRVMYMELVGDIEKGMHLDHLCRTTNCVNPLHLEPVSCRENAMRGSAAARRSCPAGHPYSQENIWRNRMGHRFCRECNRQRSRANYARSRAEK